jgi:C4-dicarboxylate-specific signal transduction histidine kinase
MDEVEKAEGPLFLSIKLPNAVEAMSAVDEGARELLISTEQSRTNGVLVAVRDSGPGIDPEHIEPAHTPDRRTQARPSRRRLSLP